MRFSTFTHGWPPNSISRMTIYIRTNIMSILLENFGGHPAKRMSKMSGRIFYARCQQEEHRDINIDATLQWSGGSEFTNFHATFHRYEEVGSLDIQMDDGFRVEVIESLEDLVCYCSHLHLRKRSKGFS
ncbi:hypothetical protein ARMSODRAFT_1024624 [Armillaria solidipes]|uniref:Uncharacterized protein n=1 Tax=Armillaria solidipes TaxID=1076256 RepID=A0A2H3AV63_9AGAR|nr:hypothetical protein ARMSODRAFT_1024624 [Armillaria solidipes]